MRVNEANAEFLKAEQTKPGRNGTDAGANHLTEPINPVNRGDMAQLSDGDRALAELDNAPTELSPQRIAEIRARVLAGAYNSLDSVDQLARRMLASGDL
jgi:hypothetical protein